MYLTQTEIEYRNALIDAAEIGARKALEAMGLAKPFLKQREAFRLYGESQVKRWIKEGLIKPIKDGSATASVRINRVQIEAIAKASNRASYLTTKER